MSLTARARVPHCSEVAAPAAREAATGSKPRRSWLSDCSCAPRSGLASRHRIRRGSKTFQCDRSSTVIPTRRRDVTMPIDSSTRTTSRATETGGGLRGGGGGGGEPRGGGGGATDDAAADVVERPAVQLARDAGTG